MITDLLVVLITSFGSGAVSGSFLWVAHHELKRTKAQVPYTFGLGITTCLAAFSFSCWVLGAGNLEWILPVVWVAGAAAVGIAALIHKLKGLPQENWQRVGVYIGGSLIYVPIISLYLLEAARPGERLELLGIIWVNWGTTGSIVCFFYWLDDLGRKARERKSTNDEDDEQPNNIVLPDEGGARSFRRPSH